jgi:hypothetical protein
MPGLAVEGMGAGDAEKYVAILNRFNFGAIQIRRLDRFFPVLR